MKPMRKHTVRAITWSLSAAVAVLLWVVGSSAAVADAGGGHRGGRSSMSSDRHVGHSAGRMGRAVRGARVRGGRHTIGHDRGGRRHGWFNRDRRHHERTFISFGGGSFRGGYRSSRALFFGYSFRWSEYRRSSGPRYRRDVRREYRSDEYRSDVSSPRANDSSVQRAAIEHPASQSGPMYVPLVASPAAPEVLPMKN